MFYKNKMDKRKKKRCYFVTNDIKLVDYKDTELLKKFVSDNGKILPCRLTGTSRKYQKLVSKAVKRARQAALLPYSGDIHFGT
ncbi:MAG: 30S ribosomal protein S18 [Candidatus Sericytochromatia bacterium]|jgi:small subunit ribosomal protein S18